MTLDQNFLKTYCYSCTDLRNTTAQTEKALWRLLLFLFCQNDYFGGETGKSFYTAVRALVKYNGTLLCKIDFNRNLSF